VVHRDLKPSNILITPEGSPKLLDFGIAKLLGPERSELAMDRTRTELRALTPDYASPEQVRGEKLTTTSDVYSLGVLLYELLTGHRPYRSYDTPSHELARVIWEQEPTRPSAVVNNIEVVTRVEDQSQTTITPETVSSARNTQPDKLRRSLSGDLDNIVLMSLRKEPERRYQSAAQFATDIQRHLDGLPVIAHKDTLFYRGAKFARRHRFGVLAASLIILTLMGGLVATVWQWRNAQVERIRAESLFNNVRHLANSFMFEFHDSIVDLPGSTPARLLVVNRALDYLDRLSKDSADNPSLQVELAAAYQRVGDVQGQSQQCEHWRSCRSD
jgi:serine/threonine protein kinase